MASSSQARRRGRPRKRADTEVAQPQRHRLRVIERAAFWGGAVGRQVLVDAFGLHRNHVSRDFTLYEELAPANIRYDHREKCYYPSPGFTPKLGPLDPETFLRDLLGLEGKPASERLAALGVDIDAASVPGVPVAVAGPVLAAFTRAISQCSGLRVTYQSLYSSVPSAREFWPHVLVHSGHRWLGRGWDATHGRFIYLALARVLDVEADNRPPPRSQSEDELWNEFCHLEVVPGRWLPEPAKVVVASEYGMEAEAGGHVLKLKVRRAMVAFTLDMLRLRPGDSGPRRGLPLELRNLEAVLADDRAD